MAISDYSATAASNTTIGGIDVSGATGKVKDGDNVMRQMAADMKAGVITGYTTTATAAGTTTLTVASNSYQYFTGSTTQTVVMPVTSTLELGRTWIIVNTSTGALTVNSSGGNLITTIPAGSSATVQCILLTGTTAASWKVRDPLYSEGTFTVTASFSTPGTSSWAYTIQTGIYTKIGNSVTFAIDFSGTPTIGTGSGSFQLSFPFNAAASPATQVVTAGSLNNTWTWPVSRTHVTGVIAASTNLILLQANGSAATGTGFLASNMTGGSAHTVRLGGTIIVA